MDVFFPIQGNRVKSVPIDVHSREKTVVQIGDIIQTITSNSTTITTTTDIKPVKQTEQYIAAKDGFMNVLNHKTSKQDEKTVPKLVFIIPYRDRVEHKKIFLSHMIPLLSRKYKEDEYKILFIHQDDRREFNRGAMKNLGFRYIRNIYRTKYREITFVFHDIDTFPTNLIPYETTQRVIKHFYGFKFALGGIFSITGLDFERIGGFPNYWGWGFEDNVIQKRVVNANPPIEIDRSHFIDFIPFYDQDKQENPQIIQLFHGLERKLDAQVTFKMEEDQPKKDGWHTIRNIWWRERQQNIQLEVEENKIVDRQSSELTSSLENVSTKPIQNVWMIDTRRWEVPVSDKTIGYETRTSFKGIRQSKVNMEAIIDFVNRNQLESQTQT